MEKVVITRKRIPQDIFNQITNAARIDLKRWHVVPRDEKWAVRKDGAAKAIAIFSTQNEAIAKAKKIATAHDGYYVIHDKNGLVSEIIK